MINVNLGKNIYATTDEIKGSKTIVLVAYYFRFGTLSFFSIHFRYDS